MSTRSQFARFIASGIILNLLFYIIYLFLSSFLGPYRTILITYPTGIIVSYAVNKGWVFKSSLEFNPFQFAAYIATYIVGLLFDLLIIYVFHELCRLPHQIAQLIAVGFVGLFLFIALKFGIFSHARKAGL